MTKAEEFAAVLARWDELTGSADWARNETWRARDDAVMFLVHNRAVIARALRRDEAIEGVDTRKAFSDAMLIAVADSSGLEYDESDIADVLVAFREAVK